MRTRFKTFSEFKKDILIVEGTGDNQGRVNIICRLKADIIYRNIWRPWNSNQTKLHFLAILYFKEVLCRKRPLSKKILRPEPYYWLGQRIKSNNWMFVVVDAWDSVDKESGETVKTLKVFPYVAGSIYSQTHPIEVMENKVVLL